MNGRDLLLDTNILLFFLNGDASVSKFFYEYNPMISFISELEILSAPELSKNEKLFVQDLLKDIPVVKYADDHKEDIIKVRNKKNLKLPDAIIAALAITLGVPLVTADSAFKKVDGINLIFYKTSNN